jgi:hypothetical protein
VAGQRQRPRGEAAEGKAWLAVLSFCVGWAASVGAGLGHRAPWRASSGRGRTTSDASTLDSCTWAPPTCCGGERLGCGSAGTLRAAEGGRRPVTGPPPWARTRTLRSPWGAWLRARLGSASVVASASRRSFWSERPLGYSLLGKSGGAGGPGARSGRGEHWVDTRCQVRVDRGMHGALLSVLDGENRRPALDGREQRSRWSRCSLR